MGLGCFGFREFHGFGYVGFREFHGFGVFGFGEFRGRSELRFSAWAVVLRELWGPRDLGVPKPLRGFASVRTRKFEATVKNRRIRWYKTAGIDANPKP